MPNDSTTIPEPRKRPWFWVVLLVLLILLVGGDQIYRLIQKTRVDRVLAALRKEGYPVNVTELGNWHAQLPDKENAALRILEASDDLIADTINPDKWPRGTEELGPDERDTLREILTNNLPALDVIHAAAQIKQSRFPIDYSRGPAALLPHLAKVKKLAQFLRLEALISSEEGQPDRAVRAVLDNMALARSLDTEPILISQLVRTACLSISCASLERVLSQHALTDSQLRQLSEALLEAERSSPAAYEGAFVGEVCIGNYCFRASPSELGGLADSDSGNNSGSAALLQVAYPLYGWTGLRDRDALFYVRTMHELIATARAPFPERLTGARQLQTSVEEQLQGHHLLIFSRMLLPSLGKAMDKAAEGEALLRCARTALAVELCRLKTGGAVPEDLTQVAPSAGGALPLDPINNAPLHFRKLSPGYLVYSVGADDQDDGGVTKGQGGSIGARKWPPKPSSELDTSHKETGRKWSNGKNYDVVFAVER
jgi:hypothetical protein